MAKDLDQAIESNISSPKKLTHGSIKHLNLQELVDADSEVNIQEEDTVEILKSSIFVDVNGMADETIQYSLNTKRKVMEKNIWNEKQFVPYSPKVTTPNFTDS